MAFVSVPEERIIIDLQKTWLSLFAEDNAFADMNILPEGKDKDEEFKIPSLVLKRVGAENFSLDRLQGYYNEHLIDDDRKVSQLYGYRITANYQFDILTRSLTDEAKYVGLVRKKLQFPNGVNPNCEATPLPKVLLIPIKDWESPTSFIETDLRIMYQYHVDIQAAKVSTFDPGLHQYSISVNFKVDYMKEHVVPSIRKIELSSKII